jgi:hypothetical protein
MDSLHDEYHDLLAENEFVRAFLDGGQPALINLIKEKNAYIEELEQQLGIESKREFKPISETLFPMPSTVRWTDGPPQP